VIPRMRFEPFAVKPPLRPQAELNGEVVEPVINRF